MNMSEYFIERSAAGPAAASARAQIHEQNSVACFDRTRATLGGQSAHNARDARGRQQFVFLLLSETAVALL
jgi:hypothetical protein